MTLLGRRAGGYHGAHATMASAMIAVAATLGLAVLALGPAAPAFAHNFLVASTPEAGAVQTDQLDAVSLQFNDIVLDLAENTSFVEVTGPDGASDHFETACPVTDDRTVTAPVALGGGGEYTVVWQVVSADGHVISDSHSFEYQPAPGTPAAKGSMVTPCTSGEAPSVGAPGSDGEPRSSATPQPVDSGVVIGIASGIIALALVGVGVVLFVSRKSARGQ